MDVQVDLSDGLIATALVGRPDTSITEARSPFHSSISSCTWDRTALGSAAGPALKLKARDMGILAGFESG